MSEWREYKLGEIAEVLDYKRKPISSMERIKRKGAYPYYGASGIIDYLNDYIFDGEYVLISEDGENLYSRQTPIAFLAEGQFWVNNHAHVIKSDYVHNRLICYYFANMDLNPYLTGAVQPKLSQNSLVNIPLLLPKSIDKRKKIVSILSSLDDKIDLLHRENKTLEAMAETLFRQWFIEEAKEDWKEGKLGDFVNETIGGEWGKENPEGDFTKVVQCIRGTDIADLNIGLANKAPIRFVKESKFEKIEPRNGDIIMEISGGTENQSTGRVVYINEDVKTFFQYPIVFSNFCRLLRVDEKYSYFLYCYLKYLYDQDEYFNLENGSSGIKNLDYKALLYDLKYPMPKDKRIIFKFNDNVSLYFKRINKNKKQIQTLTQTRDSLLPKLISGEIKV